MPFATIVHEDGSSDVEIHYRMYGKGPIKLLFIMGFSCTLEQWHHQIIHFSTHDDYTICVYDNRGCGLSSTPSFVATTHQMANDALGLLRHLRWTGVHVVSKSMGGMIALQLACLAPVGMLASLTCINTHAGGIRGLAPITGWHVQAQWFFSWLFRHHDAHLRATCRLRYGSHVEGQDPERWAKLLIYHREIVKHVPRLTLRGIISHAWAVCTHFVSSSRLLALKHSGLPIMICVGAHDLLVRPSNSILLQQLLEAKLVLFEGCGHSINGWEPLKFNALLHDFVTVAETNKDHTLKQQQHAQMYPEEQGRWEYYKMVWKRLHRLLLPPFIYLVLIIRAYRIWLRIHTSTSRPIMQSLFWIIPFITHASFRRGMLGLAM